MGLACSKNWGNRNAYVTVEKERKRLLGRPRQVCEQNEDGC
jgi:hypothetical protein